MNKNKQQITLFSVPKIINQIRPYKLSSSPIKFLDKEYKDDFLCQGHNAKARTKAQDHLTSTLALSPPQNNTHLKAVITRAHYSPSTLEPAMLQYELKPFVHFQPCSRETKE